MLALLRPLRIGLAAMAGLSTLGALAGLVPPIVIGYLMNDLTEAQGMKLEDALWAGAIAGATLLEAAAYVGSDGLYEWNAARLYRDLRLRMFEAVLRWPEGDRAKTKGLPSRFISDVETFERVTVYALDSGSMQLVQLGTALVALGVLEPWAIPVVVPLFGATWWGTRRMQEPAARAGNARQEQLEELTGTLARELPRSGGGPGHARIAAVSERLLRAEVRLGWIRAANLYTSGAVAKLGPIGVVVAAAAVGGYQAGTLLSLYLLAQRAFSGFDGLVDLSLGMQTVRGAVARCLELIDSTTPPADELAA